MKVATEVKWGPMHPHNTRGFTTTPSCGHQETRVLINTMHADAGRSSLQHFAETFRQVGAVTTIAGKFGSSADRQTYCQIKIRQH